MDNSKNQVHDDSISVIPPTPKCVGGTLLQYFQKKASSSQPQPSENGKLNAPDIVSNSSGKKHRNNGTTPLAKQTKHEQKKSAETGKPASKKDAMKSEKLQYKSEKKSNLADLTDKTSNEDSDCMVTHSSGNQRKVQDSHSPSPGVAQSTKPPSQNPFQILMQSGKKKGVWDKPPAAAKAKECVVMSSDDDDVELEEVKHDGKQVPGKGSGMSESAKFFSIFSTKQNKSTAKADMLSENGCKMPRKPSGSESVGSKSKSSSSTLLDRKSMKGIDKSVEESKSSKKKSSEVNISAKEGKQRKSVNHKSSDHNKSGCLPAASKCSRKEADSSTPNANEMDSSSTPKKSRLKVVSDSDFESDDVQSGKRKGRVSAKSQRGSAKRPRTDSVSRTDATPAPKPATLSAAQKLVKKSRNQASRRSGDAPPRCDPASAAKPGTKQTLLTAGQKGDGDAPSSVPDAATPGRRSARAGGRSERSRPADSETESTPGRRTGGRRTDTENTDRPPCDRRTCGKRARTGRPAETSGSELDATPVKRRPPQPASASSRRRLSSSSGSVEVLPSGAEPQPAADRQPSGRRSSRPRRPVIHSDSEFESSPAKRPARRTRAPPPEESGPVEATAPRRSSRPSRPVRRLSDSEVELSPLKKPARRTERRSAAAAGRSEQEEPEVVLVRSRSAGTAAARPARAGPVDAFQMMRRGGKPPKPTPAEQAASEARRAFLASGVPESLHVQAETARRLEESLTPLFPEVSHVHQREPADVAASGESPLPCGLRWRSEQPLSPPLPVAPAPVGGLVSGLSALLTRAGAGGGGQASEGVEGETTAAADADSPQARLPCLSLPECAESLRQLLAADREFATAASAAAAAAPSPDTPQLAAGAAAVSAPGLWTERFRPRHHTVFAGGALPAAELHAWLADWSPPSSAPGWDEDGSEEPAGDGAVLLLGSTGCGKTSAVYAAAGQLGFQVLEVSASCRRSGRHLSSQLSEATQSQRVSLLGGGSGTGTGTGGSGETAAPSRSLLLLEDVQLVSEELDDGFLAAAASLAAAAKRPVVLTSGDVSVSRGRLLRALPHRLLAAGAPCPAALHVHLALAALCRGWLLPEGAAARLAGDRGDVRRALLQLQWLCDGQPPDEQEETVDTWQALTEAQLDSTEEFVEQLPAALRVVRLPASGGGEGDGDADWTAALPTEPAGRRQSGWQPPARETAAGYDGQTRRRWRCVDDDLFSDEDDARRAAVPSPAAAAAGDEAAPPVSAESVPAEERALLSASMSALSALYDVRSACDALVSPADGEAVSAWWRRRPEPDMAECEQPLCVAEERAHLLGRQLAAETLGAAARRCAGQLRAARAQFAGSGRPEPASLRVPLYDERGVRETTWEQNGRLTPAVPSLLLNRRAATADVLPSIRRMCRLECGRRATDGGRTRRFLHYFDQIGLHTVPAGLRTHVCANLM